MNANLNGLPDEATLARLANEFFAALPGEPVSPDGEPRITAPPPQTASGPPPTVAGPAGTDTVHPAGPRPAAPPLTALSNVPDSLDEAGLTVHVPPHREAGPGWDLTAPPAVLPVGLAGARADPYAPIRTQEFYFIDPLRQRGGTVPATRRSAPTSFDVDAIRRDFPILGERINGHQLVWLDNAATTRKPQQVIDRLARFYAHENSNIHRAAHELAARATDAYEEARATTARFLGAPSGDDIVFVRGRRKRSTWSRRAGAARGSGPGMRS